MSVTWIGLWTTVYDKNPEGFVFFPESEIETNQTTVVLLQVPNETQENGDKKVKSKQNNNNNSNNNNNNKKGTKKNTKKSLEEREELDRRK